jgi:CD2 antigen cytoplasmic tail-binding protein 2
VSSCFVTELTRRNTSNPFTLLSEIVSSLTTIGHLDVYSLTRESIQRMLPAAAPTPVIAAPVDTRPFQYRFSMAYVKSLPEAQRPVEREVFGKSSP